MKFVVISQRKESAPSMPKDMVAKGLSDIEKRIKDGKILGMYHLVGWYKTISIEEHENMAECLKALSFSSETNKFEVYPAMDFMEAKDILFK